MNFCGISINMFQKKKSLKKTSVYNHFDALQNLHKVYMTRLVLCKNGMQKWNAKMFLHIS